MGIKTSQSSQFILTVTEAASSSDISEVYRKGLKRQPDRRVSRGNFPPSKPRELPPQLLTDPDMNLSTHPARVNTPGIPSNVQKVLGCICIRSSASYRSESYVSRASDTCV